MAALLSILYCMAALLWILYFDIWRSCLRSKESYGLESQALTATYDCLGILWPRYSLLSIRRIPCQLPSFAFPSYLITTTAVYKHRDAQRESVALLNVVEAESKPL